MRGERIVLGQGARGRGQEICSEHPAIPPGDPGGSGKHGKHGKPSTVQNTKHSTFHKSKDFFVLGEVEVAGDVILERGSGKRIVEPLLRIVGEA